MKTLNNTSNTFSNLINGNIEKWENIEKTLLNKSITEFNNRQAEKLNAKESVTLLGKKEVKDSELEFDLSKLEELLTSEEKEYNPSSRIVTGLVNIHRMLETTLTAIQLDPLNDLTISLANGVLATIYNLSYKAKYENSYHYVFGGKICDLLVYPCDSAKSNLENAQEVFDGLSSIGQSVREFSEKQTQIKTYLADKRLPDVAEVLVNTQQVTIKGKANFSETLSWRDLAKKLQYAGQTIFTAVNKDGKAKLYSSNSFPLLMRVATLHASTVDIEGLKEHPRALAVIHSKLSAEGKRKAEWIKTPFADSLESYQLNKEEGIKIKAISDALKEDGYIPFYKKESYSKHGYIMLPEDVVTTGNAFCDENGLSQDDYSKLIVRLAKCAQAEYKYTFNTTTHVIAVVEGESTIQKEFNRGLVRTLVDGHAISSIEQHKQLGVCRVVSGSLAGESGQKTMLSNPLLSLTQESMASIAMSIGYKGIYTVSGLSSSKAKSYKLRNDFEVKETIFRGEVVKFAVKSVKEKLLITDSAVSENYEINPDNIVKLDGMVAALDTYERRVLGKRSETVFELLYNNRASGFNLVEAVQYYLNSGKIRVKEGKSRTNSQFITALESQFSREVAETVMNSLVRQNKARDYRQSVGLSKDILESSVVGKELDSFKVDMKEFAELLFQDQAGLGEVFENASQQVFLTEVVLGVSQFLIGGGKQYVTFVSRDKEATISLTNSMFNSVEAVERDGYCKVSGLLAEVLYSINRGLVSSLSNTPEGDVCTITDNIANIMVEKISKARDNHLGKELTRVPTEGCNGHVIGSPLLEGNDLFSIGALNSVSKAMKSFREGVTVLYFKSPILWEGSLTISNILSVKKMMDVLLEKGHGLHNFNIDFNEFSILDGKTMYQSPEKIVGNGNDSDGDRNSIICLPNSTLSCYSSFIKKLQTNHLVDAMDESIAVGGLVAKKKWNDEVEGLYLSSLSNSVSYKTDINMLEQGIREAVLAATDETKNVAMYTTFQSQVLRNKGTFVKAIMSHIENDANTKSLLSNSSKKEISIPLANAGEFALNFFATEIWKFTSDVMGTIVNIDAMDQIKHSDSNKTVVKLAEVLNPKRVYNTTVSVEDVEGFKRTKAVKGGNSKGYNDLIKTALNVMFNEDSHNLSLARLINILPSNVDITILQQYVVKAMFEGLKAVGDVLTNHVNFADVIVKDHTLSLEDTLKDVLEEGKTAIKSNDIISYTLNVAFKHKNEKLISISKRNGNKK